VKGGLLPERIGLPHSVQKKQPRIYHTTGFAKAGITGLCARIEARAISAIIPLLVQALLGYVPTAGELDVGTCYIVDGALLPCWSWRVHPELYSGKRKTTGMNVQVARTITGCLAWISDPIHGSRHDNHCLGESGVLLTGCSSGCGWSPQRRRNQLGGEPAQLRYDVLVALG